MASGSERRRRDKVLTLRLSTEERDHIADKAEAHGLSVASFIRTAIIGSPGPRTHRRAPADKAELRRLIGEANRIGNNVNQIARHVNSGNGVDFPSLDAAISDINAIRGAIYKALGMAPPGST